MKKVDRDPFSNGTEYMIWEERNCGRCWKSDKFKKGEVICAIQRDIYTRMVSNEPVAQRTIDICRTMICPYRQEKRKKYAKYANEATLF